MKQIPTLVSIAALIWAVGASLRVPSKELTWAVPGYLMMQTFLALLGWWALQRVNESSTFYANLFNVTFLFVLAMAIVAMCRMLAVFDELLAAFVLIGFAASAAATAAVVYHRLLQLYANDPHGVPQPLLSAVWQGAVLTFCGGSTLVTLYAETRPTLRISAAALGFFWLVMGTFFFACSIGVMKHYTQWSQANRYVPAMLAIVCFGWLAFRLSGVQMGAERAPARELVGVTR